MLEGLAKGGAQMHVVVMTTQAGTSLADGRATARRCSIAARKKAAAPHEDVLTSQAFEPKMKELAAVLKSQHKRGLLAARDADSSRRSSRSNRPGTRSR